MRRYIKLILHPVLKTWHTLYYIYPRKYHYKGATVIVHRDVFPPYLTISTNLLVDFIEHIPLRNKKVLELGCGSGLLSIAAAQRGAEVTASDINKTALSYLKKSATLNKVSIEVCYSDLFLHLAPQLFDYILINPPYYAKAPQSIKEQAWYCGTRFEYFEHLFQQLPAFLSEQTICYMILSEDCALNAIHEIANRNHMDMEVLYTKKIAAEKNYIYRVILR